MALGDDVNVDVNVESTGVTCKHCHAELSRSRVHDGASYCNRQCKNAHAQQRARTRTTTLMQKLQRERDEAVRYARVAKLQIEKLEARVAELEAASKPTEIPW